MEFNKLVFAGLSIGCLAAAAGGSYLAVRQNQTSGASGAYGASGAAGAPVEPAAAASPDAAVTESEGVITPEPSTPAATAPSTPTRRMQDIAQAPAKPTRASAASTRPASPAPARRAPEPPPVATVAPPPASPATSGGTMWESRPSVQPSVPEYPDPEPPALSERSRESNGPPPPAPEFVDLTVPSDAVLGLQIERTVSSELARVEDKVEARVTRDVRVENRVAIPAGSTVRGSVTEVDKGGRVKGTARLAIRFHTIVLADGTQLALKSDPVIREGQSPGGESAAKVGGAAIGGAILGAILGGGRGAAIGGAVGAGAGTAAAMSNDRNPATLTAGTTVTVRMQAPVTVTVQKE
ncbi:MAG: hypothetical protein Q8O42_14645 [Acidobacteriota bacterium]|nr:hypothetical protein [Acidobacteriota bacterium]